MTPQAALTALVARLNTTDMVEARSPLGVKRASAQRATRAFSVRPLGLSPAASPGRRAVRTDGIRIKQKFSVELCHSVKPSAGQAAPVTALADLHAAIKAIVATGTTLTTDADPDVESVSATYPGAYYVQTLTVGVEYPLALV